MTVYKNGWGDNVAEISNWASVYVLKYSLFRYMIRVCGQYELIAAVLKIVYK